MSIRRLVPLGLAIVVAITAVVVLRRRDQTQDPMPAEPVEWNVHPPAGAPVGEAFRVARGAPPPVVRWKGEFSYAQVPSGQFGNERRIQRRVVAGTFTATEASSGSSSSRETAVDAGFALEESVDGGSLGTRAFHAKLSFARDAEGAVVHRSIRLDAPNDLATELELFQFAFTQRFQIPDRPVRVGERLAIDDCLELDDMFRRPLWFLFKDRAAKGGPVSEPIEGGAWIESRTDLDVGEARLRAALTHAHTGPSGPEGAGAVTIDYRAVLDGDRTFRIGDGALHRHALMLARRIRYAARDLDYTVVVRARIAMARDESPR